MAFGEDRKKVVVLVPQIAILSWSFGYGKGCIGGDVGLLDSSYLDPTRHFGKD